MMSKWKENCRDVQREDVRKADVHLAVNAPRRIGTRRKEREMPAFATHEIFGEDSLEDLSSIELLQMILRHKNAYFVGCQGPDLFYYNIFMADYHRKQNIGSRMHRENTASFFEVYLEEMLSLSNPFELVVSMSYILGFLSHYSLDCEVHPYVYSRTDFHANIKGSSKKTIAAHRRLEALIDLRILMHQREMLPSEYYPEKYIHISRAELNVIADMMSRVMRRVYYVGVRPENIRLSYWCMYNVTKLLYDHSGFQKERISQLESSFFHHQLLGDMIVSDYLKDSQDVMNHEGKVWNHPWQPCEYFDSSVYEMYENALQKNKNIAQRFLDIFLHILKRQSRLRRQNGKEGEMLLALKKEIQEVIEDMGNKSMLSGLEE